MSGLIDVFETEKTCEYKGETYTVRDNGAIMRHPREGKRIRPLDGVWTFGSVNIEKGYLSFSAEAVHRIVATAFLGDPPSKQHVVDHIDTNRQNNRPENLRWVTRLENIVLNDITRTRLERLFNYSIEEILSDLTILKNMPSTSQYKSYSWMRTVSKEDAEKTLATLKKWVKEVSERKERDEDTIRSFNYRKGPNPMIYPLEPIDKELSLEEYYKNLRKNKVFCYKNYYSMTAKYKILEYYLNKETGVLSVATHSAGGIKSLYLTNVSMDNGSFVYSTRSFFSPDGLEKYMTLAKGEEWTGGEVFDDYC